MREIPRRRLLQLGAGTAIAGLAAPHRVLAADAGRLVIGIDEDLSNLDPAWRNSPIDDSIIRCVCSNLVSFLPGDYDYQNDAAESIDTGLTATIGFVLKPGLTFGDGFGELTAEDVKFSYERFITPGPDGLKSPYAPTWSVLKSVEVTGKYRGRITLGAPSLNFWKNGLAEVSGAILSRKAFEQPGAKTRTHLVGSGPYRLKEWVPGERILLAANPDWHGERQAFGEILLQPTRNPDAALEQVAGKQIHFARILTKDENAVRKVADSRMIAIPSSNHVGLGMNMTKTPLDDARVRKAIRLLIDTDQVVAAAYAGAADAARSIIAPLSTGYWADAPKPVRDVAAAKQLLADAGRRNPHLRLTVIDLPVYRTVADIVQNQLREGGVLVTVEALAPADYWACGRGETGKKLELFITRYSGKFDPAFIMQWFLPEQIGNRNWHRWSNPDYEALYYEAAALIDLRRRSAKYIEMQGMMDETDAFVPLCHEPNLYVSTTAVVAQILPNGDDPQYAAFRWA